MTQRHALKKMPNILAVIEKLEELEKNTALSKPNILSPDRIESLISISRDLPTLLTALREAVEIFQREAKCPVCLTQTGCNHYGIEYFSKARAFLKKWGTE